MDISKECVDVFSWRRVYKMDLKDTIAYVQSQCAKHIWFKPLSALKEEEVIKDKVILDAGCGPGLRSCIITAYEPKEVIGIDGSQPSIVAAQALAGVLHLNNVRFLREYLENIPQLLAQGIIPKADFIICAQMIHHTTDWRSNLKILYDALKDGGILHLTWLDPSSNWGKYMLKNKIAFHLGRNKESRIRIGAFLFGWLDKPKKKLPIEWEVFFADRYAAFYKFITVSQMVKVLQGLGFEILESYPCIDWEEWRRQELQKPSAEQRQRIIRFLRYPLFRGLFTLAMRVRQFMGGGWRRTHYLLQKNPSSKQIKIGYE